MILGKGEKGKVYVCVREMCNVVCVWGEKDKKYNDALKAYNKKRKKKRKFTVHFSSSPSSPQF